MAQLLDLPTETLQEIIEYVALAWRPLADLTALCYTCKVLCHIAQPILYHDFTFNRKEHWSETSIGWKLLRFADTLARRPVLRKSVKQLQLELQSDDDFARNEGSFVPSKFDLGGLRAVAPQYFSSNKMRSMWKEKKTLQVFPHVETILSIMPRLEVLGLKIGGLYNLKSTYLGFGSETSQYLANVKELALCGPTGYNDEPAKFEMIMPLIASLPQLKKLKLKNFDIGGVFRKREDRDGAQWHVSKGTLGIEDLCIHNCPMTNEILQRMIKSCRRLIAFDFKTWKDSDYEERRRYWRRELDVEALHAALSLHKDSLEFLSLNCINVFEKMQDDNPAKALPAYPSFQDFVRIKTFKIEYRRMRYELLPPNVTHLYLYDCRDVQNEAEVEAWKAVKRTSCPNIEKLEIMCTENCRGVQYQLKYMHFQWGCWTEKTREWYKDGFELKVWFKDFVDGTYHFSQGTDDTGDIDSNGEKIKDDDEEEEEEDEDEDENGDSKGINSEDGVGDDDKTNHEHQITLTPPPDKKLAKLPDPNTLSPATSSHTFSWVDDLMSDFDPLEEAALDADSPSPAASPAASWLDELISEAEHEEFDDTYPPKAQDVRSILLTEEEQDDGWRGGEWRAPRSVVVVKGTGKKRGKKRKGRKEQRGSEGSVGGRDGKEE